MVAGVRFSPAIHNLFNEFRGSFVLEPEATTLHPIIPLIPNFIQSIDPPGVTALWKSMMFQ